MGQRRNKAKWSTQEHNVEWFGVGDSKVISERDFNRLCAGLYSLCCCFPQAVDQVVLIFTL